MNDDVKKGTAGALILTLGISGYAGAVEVAHCNLGSLVTCEDPATRERHIELEGNGSQTARSAYAIAPLTAMLSSASFSGFRPSFRGKIS